MLLITPTLLNSWRYYLDCNTGDDSAEKKAREEFLSTLKREKREPNYHMKRGIEFENRVYQYTTLGEHADDEVIKELGEICKGGSWQTVHKSILGDYLLYGKSDVVKENTIYDIKFTSNYDTGKYLESMQHRIYLYCSGLPNFSYLISDSKNVWCEDYFNNEKIKDEIESEIKEFRCYLKNDACAEEIFLKNWQSY